MCYTLFYATYEGCGHKDFLNGRKCGVEDCPVNHDYNVYLEDSGYECELCILMSGMQPQDLGVGLTEYYPPTEYIETRMERVPGRWHPVVVAVPRIDFEAESEYNGDNSVTVDWYSNASLSDVDSVTSHWKLRHTKRWATEEYETDVEDENAMEEEETHLAYPSGAIKLRGKGSPARPHDSRLSKLTPRTRKHRHLVQEQLSGLPQYQETMKHRHLVDEQLAMLPHALSQPLQPNARPFQPQFPMQHIWATAAEVPNSYYVPPLTVFPMMDLFYRYL